MSTFSFALPCRGPANVPTPAAIEANGFASEDAVTIVEKVEALIVCSACKINEASKRATISGSDSSPKHIYIKFSA